MDEDQETFRYSSLMRIPAPKKRKRGANQVFYNETADLNPISPLEEQISPLEEGFNTPLHPGIFDFDEPLPTHYNVMMTLESPVNHEDFDEENIFNNEDNPIVMESPKMNTSFGVSPPGPPPILNPPLFFKPVQPQPQQIQPIQYIQPQLSGISSVGCVFFENRANVQVDQMLDVQVGGILGTTTEPWILKKKTLLEVKVTYRGHPQGRNFFLNHVKPQLIGFGLPRTRIKKKDYTTFQDLASPSVARDGVILEEYLDGSSVMTIVERLPPDLSNPSAAKIGFKIVVNVGSNQSGNWRFVNGYRIGFAIQPGPIWFLSRCFKVKSRKPTAKKKKKSSSSKRVEEEDEDLEEAGDVNMIKKKEKINKISAPPSISSGNNNNNNNNNNIEISQLEEFPMNRDENGETRLSCFVHVDSIPLKNTVGVQNYHNSSEVFEHPQTTIPHWFGSPYTGYFQLFSNGLVFGRNGSGGWDGSMLLRKSRIHVVFSPPSEKRKFSLKVRLGCASIIHIINYPEWSITHEEFGKWVRRPLVGTSLQVGRGSSYLPKDMRQNEKNRVSKVHLRVKVDDCKGIMEIEDCSKNGTELFLPLRVLVGDGVRYMVNYSNQSGENRRYRVIVSKLKLEEDDTITLQDAHEGV